MLARAPALCFSRNFLCFRFSGLLKAIKGRWTTFGLSCAVANIIKMIFVVKLRFHEERRSPVIIWLWFSSVCFGKFPKILKICENFPTDHLKAEKIGVKEAISSLFATLCFLPLPQIWSYEFLLSTGTGEGTNMFNGPANLKRFHLKERDQSSSKDPHFLYRNYNVLK